MTTPRFRTIASILAAVAAFGASPLAAQQSLVRVTSPAPDTVVRPGQTITVSVTADVSLQKVALIGQQPLGPGIVVSEPAPGIVARGQGEFRPIRFQVTIPAQIRPGIYHLTAMGATSSGN